MFQGVFDASLFTEGRGSSRIQRLSLLSILILIINKILQKCWWLSDMVITNQGCSFFATALAFILTCTTLITPTTTQWYATPSSLTDLI